MHLLSAAQTPLLPSGSPTRGSSLAFLRRRRLGRPVMLVVYAVVLVVAGFAYLRANHKAAQGLAAAHEFAQVLLPHNGDPPSPRLVIVQHSHQPDGPLATASSLTHAAYAAAHGYEHYFDTQDYVGLTGTGDHPTVNAIYALRDALDRELESKSGSEWIMWSDADTIITDPAVPAHLLLPPPTLHPRPLVAMAQDPQGLAAGVMFLRVHEDSVKMIDTILLAQSTDNLKGRRTAQCYWGLLLREHAEFAVHFYRIPQAWLNAYWVEDAEEAGDDSPVLHVHYVDGLKYDVSFTPAVRRAVNIALEAIKSAPDGSNGLAFMKQYERTGKVAREYWRSARHGIDGMHFTDAEKGTVDSRGELVKA